VNKTCILMLIPLSVGCSKSILPTETIWTDRSATTAPVEPRGSEFKTQDVMFMTSHETVQRSPQKWGKAFVEDSYSTKIYDQYGKLIFFRSLYADADWAMVEKQINVLDLNKYRFLEKLKKIEPSLNSAARIFDPKVIISLKYGVKHPLYQIDYVNAAQSGVYRLRMDPQTSVALSTQLISSSFEQGRGFVFPNGPKISDLTEVTLIDMIGDGTLTKKSHKISSESPDSVQNTQEFFKYEPSDARFDQVQAFYFVDQALHFFQNQLGITIPFFIEVKTQIGSPDKTNAMFYYDGVIYLGTGDGVTYANIMKDPSIVIHETGHALVQVLSNLPMGQGEGGSLNEAFADFFATSFLNNPNLGEVAFVKGPYSRTVDNQMKVSDKNGSLYHDSLIVSGTFYELQKKLGKSITLDLAVKTLERMGPNGNFSNFKQNVLLALQQGFTTEQTATVINILAQRGW